MRVYTLQSKQELPISIEEAWKFLSDPNNLPVITPSSMQFQIRGGVERPMYAGQIIEYIVTPLLGIKTNWVTEITHVSEPEYFVDEQRAGPYSLWHHKHFITEIKGGVMMQDIVHYALPYGLLGRWAHAVLVKPKLNAIFQYRKNKLEAIFGKF